MSTTNATLLSQLWEAIGYHSAQIAETGNQAPGEKLTGAMAAVEAALSTAAQPPAGWVLVPVERSYDQRANALIAFNTTEGTKGKDRDDALQAAWDATLAAAPKEAKAEPVQPERAPLIHQQIERAAQKLAEVMDYPWEHMPEQGRKTMRENVLAVLEAAYGEPAHKEQPNGQI